ncbi:MAG: Smr/MutS family protein [Burkholderiales bacterium]|nr:Smr/MutS family protein [Burkholderiales bacterium]
MRSATSTNLAKPKPPSQKANIPTADDAALFRDAVGDARKLPDPERLPPPPPYAKPIPRQRLTGDPPAHDLLTDHVMDSLDAGDPLTFQRPGLSQQTIRRLRRGHWVVKDELDLHGLNREQAREQLVAFLNECQQRDSRCVRIIHGKGLSSRNNEPVLKQLVKSWLMQREDVLAFVQARPAEGGSGAVIVMLKQGK